ncbi:MAG: efflux RND transporter periplasmic adaptor subunit [Kiritimatiellia bacterium]
MKTGKTYILMNVFFLMLTFLITGCGQKKETKKKAGMPPLVETAVAEETRLVEHLETTGELIAVNTVTLEATVEGPISFCPWREGDEIKRAGEKLIVIDRPLYKQELAAAQAARDVMQARFNDLKAGARPEEIAQAKEKLRHFIDCTAFAESDLKRVRSLVKSGTLPAETAEKARVGFIKCQTQLMSAEEELAMLEAGPTKTELAVARASVNEAAAKAQMAQAKLDECSLYSPFAGVITEVYVRQGDLATPRTKLLKMMDPSSLVVRAGLPEKSATHIVKGTEASVRLDAFPNRTFKAEISRIYPRIEHGSRTRIVEAVITEKTELLPHMFARIKAQGIIFENAVTVPVESIITTPRGYNVVYVLKNGEAEQQKVVTGIEQNGAIQILEGLKAGETVVTAGNLNLRNGAKVRIRGASAASDTGNSDIASKPEKGEGES